MKKIFFAAFCLFTISAYALPYQLEQFEFNNHRVRVVTVNPKDVELHLINCGGDHFKLKNVEAVAYEYEAPIAINGGFFQTSGAPNGVFYSKPLEKKQKAKFPGGLLGGKITPIKHLLFSLALSQKLAKNGVILTTFLAALPFLFSTVKFKITTKRKQFQAFAFSRMPALRLA